MWPFLIGPSGQTAEPFLAKHLPDSGVAEGSGLFLERSFDVVDGVVLFAERDNQLTCGVLLGLGAGSSFTFHKKHRWVAAELVAQNPKGTWRVAEARGDFGGGKLVVEVGAEGFVLTVSGGLRFEEEPARVC